MYYTYILRCNDHSLYTGITSDLNRRMHEHFYKTKKCAKYTYVHTVSHIEAVWQSENRSLASKLEYYIKQLPKIEKESLIKNKNLNLLNDKIDIEKYNFIVIK